MPHGPTQVYGERLPSAAAPLDDDGDGDKRRRGPSPTIQRLSPSSSTKPAFSSSARAARPTTGWEHASDVAAARAARLAAVSPQAIDIDVIAAAVDGDAAAGEEVTDGVTGALRPEVAFATATVAASTGGLGGNRGRISSPVGPIDAEEGCVVRPTEPGLEAGLPVAAEAEAESFRMEEIASADGESRTPQAAPLEVAAAVAATAAAEGEVSDSPEEVLDDDDDDVAHSRTPPGVQGIKGVLHALARPEISGRDGDSSAGRGKGEEIFLAGTAQVARPDCLVSETEAELSMPVKDAFGGEGENEPAAAAVVTEAALAVQSPECEGTAAAAVQVAGGEGKVVAGGVCGSGTPVSCSTSTLTSTLVPAGGGRGKGNAAMNEVALAAAAAAAAEAAEEQELEGVPDGYRGDAAYAGLLIAEHLELFFRQQVRFCTFALR